MKDKRQELYKVRMPGFTAKAVLNKTTSYYRAILSNPGGSLRGGPASVQPALRNDAHCIAGDGSMSCDCAGSCVASTTECKCL